MKCSIVIAIYNSHEIVRRQLLHFENIGIPDDMELILVDDGSEPPLFDEMNLKNCFFIETKDKRRWTQGLARMRGIEAARGEYIFCTDIDHIISKEAMDFARSFDGDKAVFKRRFAYLDEFGFLVTDKQKVLDWGLLEAAIRDEHLSDGVHGNTWLMKKSIFYALGGYSRKRCESGTHLQGEDRAFNKQWSNAVRAGKYAAQVTGPPIYYFPMGKYHKTGDDNPHGLFHDMVKEKWGDAN